MFNPYLYEIAVDWHHDKIRRDFAASQRPLSARSTREAIGHTFIRIGTAIHGKAREACEECTGSSRSLVNPRPASAHS